MADTTTAKLGAVKPEVGASADTWGTKQNAAFDIFDAAISGTPATVASAATTDLSATTVPTINITGSVGITSFGNAVSGMIRKLFFSGTPLITHSASIIMLGGRSRQIVAGDTMEIISSGAGVWQEFARNPKPPTYQDITATGLWVNPGCTRTVFDGVGGGGAGGGVAGSVGNWASTGGGGSGFCGKTGTVDVSGTASATVTIGAGGAAGAAGNNVGGTGGSTSVTIGATTYTWPGGDGSPGATANASDHAPSGPGTFAALGTNVKGSSNQGNFGWSSVADTDAYGGAGAPSPFGKGGDRSVITTTGGLAGNPAAANTGAGGSGACTGNQAINRAGGAGGSGFMRVWEFYD